jgi:hypothetical protein
VHSATISSKIRFVSGRLELRIASSYEGLDDFYDVVGVAVLGHDRVRGRPGDDRGVYGLYPPSLAPS